MVNMSKRMKSSGRKNRDIFKGRMMTNQSTPFIQKGIPKANSPDRTEMEAHTRKAQSRVSRYNFNKQEMEHYTNFVDLISMFDSQ